MLVFWFCFLIDFNFMYIISLQVSDDDRTMPCRLPCILLDRDKNILGTLTDIVFKIYPIREINTPSMIIFI